jgi:hypothetical protein
VLALRFYANSFTALLNRKPRPYLRLASVGAIWLGVGVACVDAGPEDCARMLTITIGPWDTTVAVGAQFPARMAASACAKPITDMFVWASQDTSIAVVDSLSGVVTARHVGRTSVRAVGRGSAATGVIPITVR